MPADQELSLAFQQLCLEFRSTSCNFASSLFIFTKEVGVHSLIEDACES